MLHPDDNSNPTFQGSTRERTQLVQPKPRRTRTPSRLERTDAFSSSALRVSPIESILRRPLSFAIPVLLGIGCATVAMGARHPTFFAQTTLMVVDTGVSGESVPLNTPNASGAAYTFAGYGFSSANAAQIFQRTRLSPGEALPALQYDAQANSPFINIRAKGATPGAAFRLAEAASEGLKEVVGGFRKDAEARLTDLQDRYKVSRAQTLAAESERLDLETKLTGLQNDLLFDPASDQILANKQKTEAALQGSILAAETARAQSEAQLDVLSEASLQLESGLGLKTFTKTFLAGSTSRFRPDATTILLLLVGVLIGLSITTTLENRELLRAAR